MASNGNMMPEGGRSIIGWVMIVAIIALILLIMLILFGNLSGNVGFDSGSTGYNDTQGLISNYSKSATNVGEQFPVTGTIVGIALLLLVLLFILGFAISRLMKMSNSSNANFG